MPDSKYARRAGGAGLRCGFLLLSAAALIAGGCGGPEAVEGVNWQPDAMTDKAMAELDTNGDGTLDAQELSTAPGIKAALESIDTNGDQRISRDELLTRFRLYEQIGEGLQQVQIFITLDNRPLANAEVTFEPEPFLEGVIVPAHGTTDYQGMVTPTAEGAPINGVMRSGMYRVRITSPERNLPAKFNTETEVGLQVSPANEAGQASGVYRLQLKS